MPDSLYLILSQKWTRPEAGSFTWYAPNAKGYVNDIDHAGRYTAEEAAKHVEPGVTIAVEESKVLAESICVVPYSYSLLHQWSLLPQPVSANTVDDLPLNVNELIAITAERALRAVNGNRAKAAELMGVGERTLYRWLKHGLGDDPTPQPAPTAKEASL